MSKTPKLETITDYLARDETERIELIRGAIVEKDTTVAHSLAQAGTTRTLGNPFQRKPGSGGPGGWWFFTELELRLGGEIFRPDVCGFRRDRMLAPPPLRLVAEPRDWVCEILSPSKPAQDRVSKFQTYFTSGVPHYWIIDPVAGSLEVFRHTPEAYALVLTALRGQRVRPEPFDAIDVRVDELLGDDPED